MKIALVSPFLSSFLFLYFLGCVEGDKQGDSRMNTLKSLIYNNAETTVKLDSTALKQLIHLSTTGTFPNHKQRVQGVGFSVYVKSKQLKLGKGQTAIYDGILTNDGNGYDVRTGIFTCPVAGTYLFVVDSLSAEPTWIHILRNKDVVGSAHIVRSAPVKPLVQISRTIILKARKGDRIKVVSGSDNALLHNGSYSGFSGTLLH